MLEQILYTVKNGTGTAIYKKTVDNSKPKMQVVGNFYEFNSKVQLVSYNQ